MAKNKIEIPKLILDHLLQYGNTSILGLGTLFYKYHSAYLSDDKSLIFPPSNSLHFKENIDDPDQFVTYVANRLDIPTHKAVEKVDKYGQYIINNLLNYGKADISTVGLFVKEGREDIKFVQSQGEVNSDFFGLLPVKLNPIQFFKGGEMKDTAMAVSTAAVPNRTAVATTISTTTHTQATYNYNEDDDSSWLKPLFWIFGLVLLSVLLFKGCEAYKSNQVKQKVDPIDTTIVDVDKSNGEQEVSDKRNIEKGTGTAVVDSAIKVNKPTECVIILGAFESARNAMKMSTKVSQMGYEPYEEYFDTMDVTRVGFKFDCSQKDLKDFMIEVRKDIAKDAWYLVPRITVE